jgi:hypothetical protein
LQKLNLRWHDAGPRVSFAFIDAAPEAPGLRVAEPRRRFDLASAVRLVARRHLPSFQSAGRGLGCELGKAVVGRWRRQWLERTMGGVLSLAIQLIPDEPVTVVIRREGQGAVVDATCPPPSAPARGQARPDLRRLTRAREAWAMDVWLWRAMARSGGGRLQLLHDQVGPVGIRLVLGL